MPRYRTISRDPEGKNFYLVDASFLAAHYIPVDRITNISEHAQVERSQAWWAEIVAQLRTGKALVYVPDICIAEAFKVLAKKYYRDQYFLYPVEYQRARRQLSLDIHIAPKSLRAVNRRIKFHDISTNRDIIISVDRFHEIFIKHNLNVSVPDLVILATGKYLIDFYNIPKQSLYIVTLDTPLWRGSKKFADIPSAFNPNFRSEIAQRVFKDAAG